ncbi:MAG: ABC transporter permease [Anaerolineae bacterium]|nr:ABC transporter permease [Anaerolineae bacterium]
MSYSYGVDSATILLPRLARTAFLNACAMTLAFGIAAPMALYAARFPRAAVARALVQGAQALLMIPEMAVALLLVAAAVRWGIPLPGGQSSTNAASLWPSFAGAFEGLTAPCIALALGAFPIYFRHLRSALVHALQAPYVHTARTLGLPSSVLYLRYVLPAAANPLLSLFGLSVGGMLSASLVVETITSWPGMGPLMLEAVLARDQNMVVGGVLLSGAALLLGNLMADVALLRLDARIRS